MSVIHEEPAPHLGLRLLAIPVVIGVGFLVLLARLWYLQVVQADELRDAAKFTRTSQLLKLAPRGLVVDRQGRLVAGVRPAVVITAVPSVVRQHPETIRKLADMVGVPEAKLWDKVSDGAWRPHLPTPVHVGASIQTATRIAEQAGDLPGLGVESEPLRTYAHPVELSHVLGYVWTPSERDVERLKGHGLKPPAYVGKLGVEYIYEADLMGKPGYELVEIDAKRRPQRTVESLSPVPGRRVALSIDSKLQAYALELLAGRRGAVVAIEPATGEVLCLASAPAYDASAFQRGIAKADWQALQAHPGKPLLNRAIYSAYAPGSTFKIVTTLAGQDSGAFDPHRPVVCRGYYQVGDRRFRCLGTHGSVTFERAFARSCNTYFADLAVRSGVDALRRAAANVGLGARTGIDLLGEGKGVVPTQEWIERWRDPPRWYTGDTVNFGVGQGEMSATPLQMACVAAFVANKGVVYRPHVVRAVWQPGGEGRRIESEELGRYEASSAFWNTLRDGMRRVIEEGTATVARIPGLQWGGKTGSAENRRAHLTHSWFVGVAPLDQPKIAIAVVVENAGHGSEVAAPLAKRVVARYFGLDGPSSSSADALAKADRASDPTRSASTPASSVASFAAAASPR